MTDSPDVRPERADAPEGRFFLVTGPGADAVCQELTARLPRAASVDGAVVGAMFAADTETGDLERTFLRYTAGIALADSFRFAGYDAVVADDVPDEHLDDYLDFASPASVHLVRLDGAASPDLPGLALPFRSATETADDILARLDEALVETTDGDEG